MRDKQDRDETNGLLGEMSKDSYIETFAFRERKRYEGLWTKL